MFWGLFAREQYLQALVAKLERSLHEAGLHNQNERIAYNTLHEQYDQLYKKHIRLIEMYESLESSLSYQESLCVAGNGLSTQRQNAGFPEPSYERSTDSVEDRQDIFKIEEV